MVSNKKIIKIVQIKTRKSINKKRKTIMSKEGLIAFWGCQVQSKAGK